MESLEETLESSHVFLPVSLIIIVFGIFGTYITWTESYKSRLDCLAHKNTLIKLCYNA